MIDSPTLDTNATAMPKLINHEERRAQLAEAAWRVILRDGVSAASSRTVAAEAGCSVGSLRHIFSSQSQLLDFALQLVLERASARISAIAPRPTTVETVTAIAAEMLPLDGERRAEMEVYLALFSAANSNPELRDTRDLAHHSLRATCGDLIATLDNGVDLTIGADHDLETARLHATIDGLATHLVCEPPDADPHWAYDALAWHIRSLRHTPANQS